MADVSQGFDPFRYTNGQWLRSNQQQSAARHVSFDLDKLCERAISCSPGARRIIECTKVEGGFNRAFLLRLDNGASLVARIPFSVAGPAHLITNSEVATINYIRQMTSVPVPTILDWSDDAKNPVGAEFIIMEHIGGVQLHEQWSEMTSEQHMLAVKAIGAMSKQLAALKFPAYGSLYTTRVDLPPSSLVTLPGDFCIGPHCGSRYWPGGPDDSKSYDRVLANRGPWRTHPDYITAQLDLGLTRIPLTSPAPVLDFRGDVSEHLRLHEAIRKVVLQLQSSGIFESVQTPTLLHPDLHKRNIYVSEEDNSKVVGIIDWQATAIEPSHSYADEIPDLCEYPQESKLREVAEMPSVNQEWLDKDVTICRQTWETVLKYWLREVGRARDMDEDIARILRYAPSTWRHGVTPIREDLIALARRWKQIPSLAGDCPYQPTTEELAMQTQLMPKFKENFELRQTLYAGLGTDERGWIPSDRWEDAQWLHKELYDEWYPHALSEDGLTPEQARIAWPFDPPGDRW